jgi:Predicted Fe-S oxidoreductases
LKKFKRVYIEITNICNLSCSFCPTSKRAKKILSVNEFDHILSQIAEYTDYIYLHVKGEPLLHPDLGKLLDLCHSYGLMVNITTNGTKLKEQEELLLVAPALRQINISLHSFESGDQEAKLFEEYLDDIISISKEFRDKSKTTIGLRLWNLEKEHIALSLQNRNQYVLHKLEQAFHLDYSIADYFLSSEHTDNTSKQVIPRGLKLSRQIYLNQSYEFIWPDLDAPYIGETGFCYGLKDQLAILSDGTVVPCCLDGEGIINLGNIKTETLTNILSSARSNSIQNGFSCRKVAEPLCQHCGYRERFDR